MASDLPSSEPTFAAVPAETTKSAHTWRSWVISGVVAGVVALGMGVGYSVTQAGGSDAVSTNGGSGDVTAGSSPTDRPDGFGGFARLGVSGEITAIDGDTLTIASTDPRSGETTNVGVTTTGDTTFTETVEGELGDVAVGDNVVVVVGDDRTAATALIDNGDDATGGVGGFGPPGGNGGTPPSFPEGTPPTLADGSPPSLPPGGPGGGFPGGDQGGAGNFSAGTVTAIDGGTVTLAGADGTSMTVTVGQETTVTVTREISLSDLAVGDMITATPTDPADTTDDGAVTASTVRKGVGGFAGPRGFGPPATGDTSG